MKTTSVTVMMPEDLVSMFESVDEAGDRAREALVLSLLRQVKISQGRAAELLGISRWEMMQLAAHEQIPAGPATVDEFMDELATIERIRHTR